MWYAEIDIDAAVMCCDGGGRQTRTTQARGLLGLLLPNCSEVGNPPTMARQHKEPKRPILTAVLTTGVARVTHGMRESAHLIDEILTLDHVDSESILYIGDVEYHSKKSGGPYPNHRSR